MFTSFCTTFSHQCVNQLTHVNLREWFEKIKNRYSFTDRNLNNIKSHLNHFFRYLVSEGHLLVNPLSQIRFTRKYTPARSRFILSQIEIMEMLEAIKEHSPVVYPFIFVLVHTGARRNEVLDLKWNDVDFQNWLDSHSAYQK